MFYIHQGRDGRGSVFVFAAGNAGNRYSTSVFINAVNNVNATRPDDATINSATLVSAFGIGKENTAMVCN